MTQPNRNTKQVQADQRRARLEVELRANLKKRKQQAREVDVAGRAAVEEPKRQDDRSG